MTNKGINKYNRLETVVIFGQKNKETFISVPKLGAAFDESELMYKEIGLNIKVLKVGTGGLVELKNNSQEDIIDTSLVIAGGIFAYAVEKNNIELKKFSDLNSRDFTRIRDSQVPLLAEAIIDKSDSIGDDLIPFGINEHKRVDARAKLTDYIDKFGALNQGKISKKTANATIKMLLTKFDAKLIVIKKLMLGFKKDYAEMYSSFETAATIINSPATRNTDNGTPNPPAPATPPAQ